MRPVRGSVRCRSISALRPRRSSNSRGQQQPGIGGDRRAAELDAKLGVEREANRASFRVTHWVVPSAPARSPREPHFLRASTRLSPGSFTFQIENAGSRQFPQDIAKSVHGLYIRMRLFLDAMVELADDIEMLFYVEPGVEQVRRPCEGPSMISWQRGIFTPK